MVVCNNSLLSTSLEKLSSGFRINRAADDAAGLAISEKMRTQIRGLDQASRNTQDGISMIQVAEGGLAGVHDMIQRIRELAVQGANGTNSQLDRDLIALEVWQISKEIYDTGENLQFNGMKILNNLDPKESLNGKILQVGANAGDTLTIDLSFDKLVIPSSYSFASRTLMDITSRMLNHIALALEGAIVSGDGSALTNPITGNSALGYSEHQQEVISFFINSQADNAINNISTVRASLGAYQNRLEYTMYNLNNSSENLAAAESRIRDADMAKLMTEFTRNSILIQASISVLSQANAQPQSVLFLLQ